MKKFPIIQGHRYFESQEQAEEVILLTRKHWLALITPFIYGLFVSVILVVFFDLALKTGEEIFGDFSDGGVEAFKVLLVMFIVLVSFSSWLIRYLNVIIVTNKHLVDVSQRAFFVRSVSTLALQDIEDVSIAKKGLLSTVFDYGNLKIQTAGELPNFELKTVADPETVQRQIMECKAKRETAL